MTIGSIFDLSFSCSVEKMAYLRIGAREMAAIAALAILLSPLLLVGGAVVFVGGTVAIVSEDALNAKKRRAEERLRELRSSVEMESALQKLFADARERRNLSSFIALGAALMIQNDPVSSHHYLSLVYQTIHRYFLPGDIVPSVLEHVLERIDMKVSYIQSLIPESYWDWEVGLNGGEN